MLLPPCEHAVQKTLHSGNKIIIVLQYSDNLGVRCMDVATIQEYIVKLTQRLFAGLHKQF